MKFTEYLLSKAVTLCFLGIGGAALFVIFTIVEAAPLQICMAELFLVLLAVFWLLCGYFTTKNRLRKLTRIQKELSEPYLLGEVLPKPANIVEKQYFDMIKIISRSAIGTAEAAVREKEEYCAYVESWIHELKTPLTACSLILSNGGDPQKLKKELKRADNLTESILYYARMRTPEKDTLIQKVSAAAAIEEAIKSQLELLIAAKIRIEQAGDFTVNTDGKALVFILKQLLINCAKYCPRCLVAITAEDGKIAVADTGIGIPQHEISRVTDRGFTGTNGRNYGDSTGMGLYIVQELCKQLDINMTIESEQKQYTKIILEFENLTKL